MPTKLAFPLLVVLQDECSDSTMTPDSGSGLTMTSSATYTNNGNLAYDDHGRLTSKSVKQANGVETAITNTYDSLSRLVAQTRPVNRAVYNYLPGANGTTTSLVASVQYSKLNSNSFSPVAFSYAYDELGYITSYNQTGKQTVTYGYDQQGQLTSVSDPNQDLYYSYEYDTYGNIRSAEAHGSYHTSDNYSNSYAYDNSKWLDLLTGFNDEPILYEGQTLVNGVITGDPTSGNPISYYNGTRWEFTWQNGRQLASASATEGDTTIDIAYTYDLNGLRTSKTITRTTATDDGGDEGGGIPVPGCNHNLVEQYRTEYYIYYRCTKCGATVQQPIQVGPPVEYGLERNVESVETEHHEYVYASGLLLREIITTTDAEGNVTTEVLDFTYDAGGSPYTLTYTNGATSPVTYYYVVNLQGDVMRLVSANGATVAEYWYGPYGEVLTASGAMAEVNPLRYRGYCYDAETEFYYLQSRYYDPVVCRFVNADGYTSTGQGFLGWNMFAYCKNNPVNHIDRTGEFAIEIGALSLFGVAVVVVLCAVILYMAAKLIADLIVILVELLCDYASDAVLLYKEHTKNARKSTQSKHQKGQRRKGMDRGGEKGDMRRTNYRSNKVKVRDHAILLDDLSAEDNAHDAVSLDASTGVFRGKHIFAVTWIALEY